MTTLGMFQIKYVSKTWIYNVYIEFRSEKPPMRRVYAGSQLNPGNGDSLIPGFRDYEK